jgi:histidinol dehydrogenase
MNRSILPRRSVADFSEAERASGTSAEVHQQVGVILERVRTEGETAVREYANRFDGRGPDEPLYIERGGLLEVLEALAPSERARLERIGERIRAFAEAQREALASLTLNVPGGQVGHRIDPVDAAGCYAPGGRYPLPSSVLMTAITARTAGVRSVWVASPNPAPITLAAAAVAEADGVLAVGGAHAIAGLALGMGPVPRSDVVVGPGNSYVTAAKEQLAGRVSIDMLAGPSELVIISDESANPQWIAADLLAQAEHDPEAVPILITIDAAQIPWVEAELAAQLTDLPTARVARVALANGGVIVCSDLGEAARAADAISPEHLQLSLADPEHLLPKLHHYGALFVGEGSAEVFGDYGVGPNHVLPTAGTARSRGGLSVMDFLRVRTWMQLDETGPTTELIEDAAWLARREGLEAHARAAELRCGSPGTL